MDGHNLTSSNNKVLILVGTRKGAIIFSGDQGRKTWQISDLMFKSWNVMHMTLDQRDRRLHAAVVHDVFGPSTHYSDDMGATWVQAAQVPVFSRPSRSGRPLGTPDEARDDNTSRTTPEKVLKVWNITPGRYSEPGVLYAGIEPGALFISHDRGQTWELNESLYDHPQRAEWFPGAGGLGLHTILLDPEDTNRMYVAVSTGGCYRSDDGGATWLPRNKNVRTDFLPNKYPAFGQCVHKMALHPSNPEVIYQQNHCGVYRSDNAADDWIDIGKEGLPSRFGFPIVVHPHEPKTIYVVLEESDDYRLSVDEQFTVWRSRDGGGSWQKLTNGLPARAYLVVFRQAMALDTLDNPGVYVGTSTGQVFYSRDAGDSWEMLADFLPPVLSVEIFVLD
jgi:hypothetical protein